VAHAFVARISLIYVLSWPPTTRRKVQLQFPYCAYSAENWRRHLNASESGMRRELENTLVRRIFERTSFQSWLQIFDPVSTISTWPSSPIYCSSGFGLVSVTEWLLKEGADVNGTGCYGTALAMASSRNDEAMVCLLLDRGADIHAQAGSPLVNALYLASERGHETIVHLLGRGANVNIHGEPCGTPLGTASQNGHEAVVRLLLDCGAKVNAEGARALYEACDRGHDRVVSLLLDRGADVNVKVKYCLYPLEAATNWGHEALVRLLLEKGADVNAGFALSNACYRGDEAVARLLLDRGADIDPEGYESALYVASENGHEGIIRLLLERGADPHAKGGLYGSALQRALQSGREGVVRLLCKHIDK
jgi:ankyrin repeat protein